MLQDILGINERNVDYVMSLNKRKHYSLVDNKLIAKKILIENNIKTPALLAATQTFFTIDKFLQSLSGHTRFVIKPARGFGGGGIVVVTQTDGQTWITASNQRWTVEQQKEHCNEILYGVYAIDNQMDSIIAEAYVQTHPVLQQFCTIGVPDIRVLLYRGNPVCAMLRVPTMQSGGKANLHAGGFAVPIDISTAQTGHGWHNKKRITNHPEKQLYLGGHTIPFWDEILSTSCETRKHFPLDYMGIDFVIDATHGPLILELNARPGLEIQNVIGQGLKKLFR